MLIPLPNGLIDGVDHFNYAEVDELRGKQQNYLADQELVVGNIGHVPKILEDMLLSLQTKEGLTWKGDLKKAVWKLPSSDLETILIRVRENTYGGKFYHGAVCTHCDHEMKELVLQLEELKIDALPIEELMVPKKVKLPKSKMEVELKATFLRDIFEMIKITTNKQDKLVTSLVPLSISKISAGTKKDPIVIEPVTSEHIEELSMKDLMYLQEQLNAVKLEGSIDTNIEIDCPNCHKEFSIKLNAFDPSFFDPTKGSTSGTM